MRGSGIKPSCSTKPCRFPSPCFSANNFIKRANTSKPSRILYYSDRNVQNERLASRASANWQILPAKQVNKARHSQQLLCYWDYYGILPLVYTSRVNYEMNIRTRCTTGFRHIGQAVKVLEHVKQQHTWPQFNSTTSDCKKEKKKQIKRIARGYCII